MQKWEYKVIDASTSGWFKKSLSFDEVTENMNELGQEGWELVSVAPVTSEGVGFGQTSSVTFIFKRERSR